MRPCLMICSVVPQLALLKRPRCQMRMRRKRVQRHQRSDLLLRQPRLHLPSIAQRIHHQKNAAAPSMAPAIPIPCLAPGEREAGKVWTYEVIGNRIQIRKEPKLDSEVQGEYLETGELFNVSERMRGADDDPRIYLQLMDGRGFVYNLSSKDVHKVVVQELGTSTLAEAAPTEE